MREAVVVAAVGRPAGFFMLDCQRGEVAGAFNREEVVEKAGAFGWREGGREKVVEEEVVVKAATAAFMSWKLGRLLISISTGACLSCLSW